MTREQIIDAAVWAEIAADPAWAKFWMKAAGADPETHPEKALVCTGALVRIQARAHKALEAA